MSHPAQPVRPEPSVSVVTPTLGRPREAATAYRLAASLDPGLEDPHVNLGVLLASAGDLDAAARSLERALRLNHRNAFAHFNLALVKLRQGDADVGRRHLHDIRTPDDVRHRRL